MLSRRAVLAGTAAVIGSSAVGRVQAQAIQGARAPDRVFICNEDSSTLSSARGWLARLVFAQAFFGV